MGCNSSKSVQTGGYEFYIDNFFNLNLFNLVILALLVKRKFKIYGKTAILKTADF